MKLRLIPNVFEGLDVLPDPFKGLGSGLGCPGHWCPVLICCSGPSWPRHPQQVPNGRSQEIGSFGGGSGHHRPTFQVLGLGTVIWTLPRAALSSLKVQPSLPFPLQEPHSGRLSAGAQSHSSKVSKAIFKMLSFPRGQDRTWDPGPSGASPGTPSCQGCQADDAAAPHFDSPGPLCI